MLDVKMEKTQKLVAGIEGFDSTKLKHTETQEKNPLPDQDGKLKSLLLFGFYIVANSMITLLQFKSHLFYHLHDFQFYFCVIKLLLLKKLTMV